MKLFVKPKSKSDFSYEFYIVQHLAKKEKALNRILDLKPIFHGFFII